MAAQPKPTTSRTRLQAAAVVGFSAAVLVAVIIATAVFGVGARTSYGSGIDPALGNQITRDFLEDQDAEAAALSKSDQALLNNRLSDSALADVVQQIQGQAAGTTPTVSFHPASITVSRAQDPSDPSLLIEVGEDGVKTVTRNSGPNAAPTQDEITFHGDFWVRLSGGRYLIADQSIQTEPSSPLPQVALAVVALVWVGLAYVLYWRTRLPKAPPAVSPVTPLAPIPPVEPTVFEAIEEPEPATKTLIRTFGGLQLIEGGKDWAPALSGRQAMAFVWRRVFLAVLDDPSGGVVREVVARQTNPTVDRETQLRRLRGLISEGLRELPEPLRQRIILDPLVLRFDLADCTIDALELRTAAAGFGRLKILSPSQASRARRVLEATHGTFMPEFEMVEDVVTDHHPTCTVMIQDLRKQLSDRRAELLAVLARAYIAGRRADLAVELLEPTLHELPDNADLRKLLADAYRAIGREADARALAGD